MIDIAQIATCAYCEKPIQVIPGHRKRNYCNNTCKEMAYRARKAQQQPVMLTIVDDSKQQRIFDRAKLEARFMDLGQQMQYPVLLAVGIFGGSGSWQSFMARADDDTLLKAIASAEYYLDNLIALRGDPQQRRIADLERENKDLQERLDLEERFRIDVEVRTFKAWLRTHPQPRDTDFAKRFIDDRDMPMKASRSKYEAMLKASLSYSNENMLLFADAWKTMLLEQS